ncbi:MAG: hypothetical protein ACI841_000267 [Planctomycetota bacterium]|jgi:hypothetical protein
MGSQFVDFNADGLIDLVTATFDGSPHIAYGTKDGFEEPAHIMNKQGKRILLGQFWDFDAEQWTDLDKPQCTSAVAFDWDDDGDYDLLLGEYGGGDLYLCRNEGKAGKPAFSETNELLHAGGKPFALNGGITAPRLVDWDGDGLTDLVIGSFGESYKADPPGGVYLYRNIGKQGAPQYAAALALIAPAKTEGSEQARPNVGMYADPVDVNGDGALDLIVGGYSIWQPTRLELTHDQVAELAGLRDSEAEARERMLEENERLMDAMEGLEGDERGARWKELTAEDAYVKLREELSSISARIQTLDPKLKRESAVWIYLQEPGGAVTIPASAGR